MVTYWKMKNGKKMGKFRVLQELSPCQKRNVENEMTCKIVMAIDHINYLRYTYKVCIDDCVVDYIKTANLISKEEYEKECNHVAERYLMPSTQGITIKRICLY